MRHVSVALALLALTAVPASAAPLDITSIVGSWQNADPASSVTAIDNQADQGTDQIRWGGEDGNINSGSGYNFTPGADLLDVQLGTAFALGTFTHVNNVIPIGSSIESVQYDFSFSTNGVPASISDVFSFSHNETPNFEPCPTGSVSTCDDIVSIGSLSIDQLINVGGQLFFFNLIGFSTDGGLTIKSDFLSAEGSSNSAVLYAMVTAQPTAIPEPTSLLLFGAGLTAVGLHLRLRGRRRKP